MVNDALMALGFTSHPVQILNTRTAVYVAMVHVLLPFMVLPLYGVLRSLDWRLVQAAQGLGAGKLARVPAGDPAAVHARHGGRLHPGLHLVDRLLHHPRAGRRPLGPDDLHADRERGPTASTGPRRPPWRACCSRWSWCFSACSRGSSPSTPSSGDSLAADRDLGPRALLDVGAAVSHGTGADRAHPVVLVGALPELPAARLEPAMVRPLLFDRPPGPAPPSPAYGSALS